jgi:octaprenyl-diphosphate synthase
LGLISVMTLDQIKAPIAAHMDVFEDKFKQSIKSNVMLLDKITNYIVKRKGKQMRPMFVFLTAEMLDKVNESTYRAASLIELCHTASLVHDDVVDDSNERRGFFSVNALWKNKIAVLIGDYLLSKGMALSVENNDLHLLKIVNRAVTELAEGELLQIEKARKLDITEAVYFKIIEQKTASLMASCCASGAASVTNDEKVIGQLHEFGKQVGLAFQIKDDLFDYGAMQDIGKPTGIDIKERKLTLPLIYSLNKASSSDKRRIAYIIKNKNNDPSAVKEVIDFVINNGGIQYAEQKMTEIKNRALELLKPFKESDAKTSLNNLVEFTINRTK